MNRREAMTALATAVAGSQLQAMTRGGAKADEMVYRQLGKTGERVSAIGLGGHHIGRPSDPQEGIRIIRTALDRGMNFLDNCWDYHDGESERRMGLALKDGYRQKAFVMTKFDGRTKKAAADQIDESLKRLQVDHIDLIQFHENIRMNDPDRFFAKDGAVEAVTAAKQAGKVRYVGFTGHKDPSIHLRMLEVAGKHGFHFDACQMPLNVMDAHFRSFGHQVVPVLVAQGIAVLGMKPMGDGLVLQSKTVEPIECLHYALSLPTSVVITGCESLDRLEQAFAAVKSFKPLTDAQMTSLLARTKDAATTGKFELFKTGTMFDGTAHNPQWMG
jgi:aryl-alcohol dehydrogenase-like predicted oxidoreductase